MLRLLILNVMFVFVILEAGAKQERTIAKRILLPFTLQEQSVDEEVEGMTLSKRRRRLRPKALAITG